MDLGDMGPLLILPPLSPCLQGFLRAQCENHCHRSRILTAGTLFRARVGKCRII